MIARALIAFLTSLTLVDISFTADAEVDGLAGLFTASLDGVTLFLGIVGAHGRRWTPPRDIAGLGRDADAPLDVDCADLYAVVAGLDAPGAVLVAAATESLATLFRALASITLATPFCVFICTA